MCVCLYKLGTPKYIQEPSLLHEQESNNTPASDEGVRRKEMASPQPHD